MWKFPMNLSTDHDIEIESHKDQNPVLNKGSILSLPLPLSLLSGSSLMARGPLSWALLSPQLFSLNYPSDCT